jgi:uncharacterized protein YkwD
MSLKLLKQFTLICAVLSAFLLWIKVSSSLSLQPGNAPPSLSYTTWSEIETNSSQLIELGRLTNLGGARGFAIQGNYAYIATGNPGYLKIVDISNPSNPQVIGQWQCQGIWICDTYGTSIWQVKAEGNYAYARGGGNVYIIDVSNPATPQLLNYLFLDNDSATPFTQESHNLYTEASNFDGSRRLDVIDVSNPLDLDRTIWPEIDYSVIDLIVEGNDMYTVADGIPGRLIIYDISQNVPAQLSQRTLNGLTYGLAKIGNFVYVGDLHAYVYTTDGQNFYVLAHKPATTNIIPIPPPPPGQIFSIIWGNIQYARTAFQLQEQYNSGSWNTLYTGLNARYELAHQLSGEYCYRVRLVNGNINGDWSSSQCFILAASPQTYLPFVAKPAAPPATPTATPPPPTPTPSGTPVPDQFAQQVVAVVNIERAAAGCNPVTMHPQLNQAALGHSQDMAFNDFFSHTGSDGSSPWQRIVAAGYTNFSTAGENIAAGYSTPQAVMTGWMNSPGHRNNILNCAFQHIGVGYYYLANDTGSVNYHHYWTQVFASP